jgi:hypothetical protein
MAARPELRAEFTDAWRSMLEQVNPSDHGARFVAGAVAEWILAAAMYQCGVVSPPAGHDAIGFDLAVIQRHLKTQFSSKAQFSKSRSDFIISNGQGGDGGGLKFPVIFMSPHIGGVVFLDPEVHLDVLAEQKGRKDSVALPIRAVIEHRDRHPECWIPLALPVNQGRGERDAGVELARELLMSSRFPNLKRLFEDAARTVGGSVVTEIHGLKRLRDYGAISEEQYQQLLDNLVSQGHD